MACKPPDLYLGGRYSVSLYIRCRPPSGYLEKLHSRWVTMNIDNKHFDGLRIVRSRDMKSLGKSFKSIYMLVNPRAILGKWQ